MQDQPLFFHLFGMGSRRKFVYQKGVLSDALFGDVVHRWQVRSEKIEPGDYRVVLETDDGPVTLVEDEQAFWIEQKNERVALSSGRVHLPDFKDHPRAPLLRKLHAELLANCLPWGPVPNLWIYPRPWYRDGAMMALAFERTGNLDAIRPWIEGLRQPFDRNNSGMTEPDNLGQVLYLASLCGGTKLPVVDAVLKEIPNFTKDNHLHGSTDFAPHPVYQTKWLKYGLQRLGLDDPYVIPEVADSYSSLFWMDFKKVHVPHPRFDANALLKYPYLNWAEAHFYGDPPPERTSVEILTREKESSQVSYSRMGFLSSNWVTELWCTPHTWHAVEIFLYFLDNPNN
jgi:hypothetical protein